MAKSVNQLWREYLEKVSKEAKHEESFLRGVVFGLANCLPLFKSGKSIAEMNAFIETMVVEIDENWDISKGAKAVE